MVTTSLVSELYEQLVSRLEVKYDIENNFHLVS